MLIIPLTVIALYVFFLPFKGGKQTSSKAQSPVEDTFKIIGKSINEDAVKSVKGIYQFELSGMEFLVQFLFCC